MGKKADIIKYIEDTFSDISPETVQIYKDKFSMMSENQVLEFFKNNDIRLYVDDDKVSQKKVDNLVKKLKIVTEEKIVYPHKGGATSMREFLVLPVQVRRLQQIAATESHSTIDSSIRDKVNQATRESKTSKLTDSEVAIMASIGLDKTLSELLSPRSDNQLSKSKMNELIRERLSFSLGELPKTPQSRKSLIYLDSLYKAMGVATDLIDNIEDIS